MVKTVSTTTNGAIFFTNGATKKKSLFGKIFKKKSKKNSKKEEVEEKRKVEIVVENVVEQVEETREEEEGIPRDPTATSPRPTDVASPRDAQEEVEEESANPDQVTEERDGADDILADLQHEEANPTPAPQQGWFGNWLDGMTHMCGPPQDQGLPTIMSGEEMDMDAITNGETTSVMSPTSTVNSEAAAPMSPEVAAPKVEEGEPELNQNKQQAEPEEIKKEEPKEEVNKVEAGPTELITAELSPRHPIDAPTSPTSLVVSPRGATKVEEVEEVAKILESPKEAPKEDEDNNTVGDSTVGDNTVGDNTLIASPQKEEAAEPAGAKMDIFAQFTACCNPIAAPSMDETEGVKADDASIKEEEEEVGPQEPDGDKEDETKSVHQDAQSVVEEKKEGEPTTPKDAPEQERIVGTIHKEKKNTKMGLSLKNSTMYQGVFIAKIKAGSLFSKTDLREGMQVLEIQGKPCPTALEEAVNMLRHAVGDLEIVAQKPKCEI